MKSYSLIIKTLILLLFTSEANAWTEVRDFNFGKSGDIAINPTSGFNDLAGASKIVRQDDGKPTLEGQSAVDIHVRKGETGYGSWGGDMYFPEYIHKGEELWLQFYLYIPADYEIGTPTGYLKFIRLRNVMRSPGKPPKVTGHFDLLFQNQGSRGTFAMLKEGESNVLRIGDSVSQPIPRDEWVKFELYIRLDNVPESQGGTGVVRFWMNDELVGERNDIITLGTYDLKTKEVYEDAYFTRVLFFTYWNRTAPKTQSLYMDHVYMTNDTTQVRNFDENGNPFLGEILNPALTISWDAPVTRTDGSAMNPDEIGGYELRYKAKTATEYTYIQIKDTSTSQYQIADIDDPSEYVFEVAAYDTQGIYSRFVSASVN
ncbi:heparin lyase I family protein [Vibrio mangrovi]|uniref:Heparin lyase I family protein n=1 Tax=Vibrio mangrovi TaxID=474394 RepID=A0A1Y6IYX0_9VIBR|nr:heparin lyase I family protein [Vibrio mangrovi]MDW6002669.1 heparin lyase I family protein [Vibrio mangrovi]SMS02828.1 hypothetical protein VIM7927_04170 [Vibrio mangrovi]